MKGRLIILISAVRTLMRSESCLRFLHGIPTYAASVPLIGLNLVIIGYELILGG